LSFDTVFLQVVFAVVCLCALAGVAWRYGGPSERWGTVIIATSWLADWVIVTATGHLPPLPAYIGIEFSVGFAFLLLAFRYDESWTAWVMVLEGGILFLADGVIDRTHPFHRIYFIISNLLGFAMIGVVLLSILTAKWRLARRAARRDEYFARIHHDTLARFGADPPVET